MSQENITMKMGVNYVGVSAGAVILNEEGKMFMAKRGAEARDDQGKWEFPGGPVELFETREAAAKMNILEKYNIHIEVKKILGVYDVIDKACNDHWVSTTYLCKLVKGEPKIMYSNKCTNIGWFTFSEVKNLEVSRITKLNIKTLLQGDKK